MNFIKNENTTKKDVSIQFARIVAMIFILLCHLFQHFNSPISNLLVQIFTTGVILFFLISGYLYGKKKINNIYFWLKKRILRLMIPVYIFVIIYVLINNFMGNTYEFKYLYIYLLNLQLFDPIDGIGNLWFVTVIFYCYLLIPIVYYYRKKIDQNYIVLFLLLFFISGLFTFINREIALITICILVYFIGYFISYKNIQVNNFMSFILIFIGGFLRILFKLLIDGTNIYDITLTYITGTLICIGIVFFIKNNISKIKRINLNTINFLDEISYYIYIVHYSLLNGTLSLYQLQFDYFIIVIIFVIISLIFAVILKYLTELIIEL